jgi:hypothetical protein
MGELNESDVGPDRRRHFILKGETSRFDGAVEVERV